MSFVIRRILVTGSLAALATVNLAVQFSYLSQASNADWTIALDRFAELHRAAPGVPVVLDVPDVGKAQLVSLYTRGHPTATYSSERCFYFAAMANNPFGRPPWASRHYSEMERLTRLVISSYHRFQFSLGPDAPSHDFWRFDFPGEAPMAGARLVSVAADESMLNNSADRPTFGRFYVRAEAEARNYLVQVDSSLACTIDPGIGGPVGLWQREPDFANPGAGMQAMGRHLLLEVLNPVPGSRLLLDFTDTPLAREGLALPPATAIGENRVGFGFVGRGAARVLSDPLTPRTIDGRYYIAIDMGAEPRKFRDSRRGLAGLYNRHLGFDPRSLVGFTRNISLVTEDQAGTAAPPSAIDHIPMDLFKRGLLFSGIYEDGWMAEAARFRLGSTDVTRAIRIKGHVPGFNPRLTEMMIEIVVDGEQVARRRLQPGDFDLQVVIPAAAGPRWIELRAEPTDSFPDPDFRVASLLLRSIALEGER